MQTPDRNRSARAHLPWNDRRGRADALRLVAFAAAVGPGIWIFYILATEPPAAEPIEHATHLTGDWTLYFLLATLAVTPLKRLLAWTRLAAIRRMLGVTAFCYLAAHLGLYVLDQGGDLGLVVSEIADRLYLTIGFAAFVGLAILAGTSFDAAIRRLRRNWKRLHVAVYPLTALGLVHFFLQAGLDVSEPVLLSGLFVGLMLHRMPVALRLLPGPTSRVLGVALGSALAAAALEYAWYATMTGFAAEKVLLANLELGLQPRPMWLVMPILAVPLPLRLAIESPRARRFAAAVRSGNGLPLGRALDGTGVETMPLSDNTDARAPLVHRAIGPATPEPVEAPGIPK